MQLQTVSPAFCNHKVAIAISASNQYAPYSGVLIQSLIDHSSRERFYDIIFLERELSIENKRLLLNLVKPANNVAIRFINPEGLFEGAECIELNYPLETYFDIIVPFVLGGYERVITLDSDMLILEDISLLYNLDLDEACLAAVPDLIMQGYYVNGYIPSSRIPVPIREYFQTKLHIEKPEKYVNAGLLVIDIKKYCQEIDLNTIVRTANSMKFAFADQDILNVLLGDKVLYLPGEWNAFVPSSDHILQAINCLGACNAGCGIPSYETAKVIHWSGRPKPWVCPDVMFGSEWWQTAQKTPFLGHIIARMIAELDARKQYYWDKYKKNVSAWEPDPHNVPEESV